MLRLFQQIHINKQNSWKGVVVGVQFKIYGGGVLKYLECINIVVDSTIFGSN